MNEDEMPKHFLTILSARSFVLGAVVACLPSLYASNAYAVGPRACGAFMEQYSIQPYRNWGLCRPGCSKSGTTPTAIIKSAVICKPNIMLFPICPGARCRDISKESGIRPQSIAITRFNIALLRDYRALRST